MTGCPFCRSERLRPHAGVLSPLDSRSLLYFRCAQCASLLQRPLPESGRLERYYEAYIDIKAAMNPGYLEGSSFQSISRERDLTFTEIGFDTRRIASSRNVELGCANGLFLRYLKERGSAQTAGIDISSVLLAVIRVEGVQLLHGFGTRFGLGDNRLHIHKADFSFGASRKAQTEYEKACQNASS